MTAVPLGITAFKRDNAKSPEVRVINRFYEKNPWNQSEQVAMIVRPALRKRTVVGSGPIRQMKYQAGVFNNDMFVVSADELYRVHKSISVADTVTLIPGLVDGGDGDTPDIAISYDYVFVADGFTLQYTDGVAALTQILMPDDVAVKTIDYIAGYILIGVADSDLMYWLEPGEVVVDPLNFVTAERLPDQIENIRTVGDQAWVLGQKSTEVWYPSGDPLAPWQRAQGRLFDRGVWGGTAVRINDSVIVVGSDGFVIDVGASPEPISPFGVTESVRKAMRSQEYGV